MKQLDILLNHSEKDIESYVNLLNKWQKAINLVSNSTLKDVRTRHILDSAQLFSLIPNEAKVLVDLGSGAGFPALVLAILNQNNDGPLKEIVLIESDTKKCLFLKEVSRQLSLPVRILNQRIELVSDIHPDVVTARALAPLQKLLELGQKIIKPQTTCLFLKGKNVHQELSECRIKCDIKKVKSITNSDSCILKITGVQYD